MKKLHILLAVTAAIASSQAFAYTGTITFNGNIVDETCTPEFEGATTVTDKDAVITLPTVGTAALTAAGKTAGETAFGIKLTNAAGETCKVDQKLAGIYFEPGSGDVNADGRLNNNGGTATKVDLQILNGLKAPIALNAQKGVQNTADAVAGTYKYFVRYYALDQVTAGTVKSTVNYTIVYN